MPIPKFIKKTRNKDKVFDMWLERVNRIEHLMGDGDVIEFKFLNTNNKSGRKKAMVQIKHQGY